MTRREFEALLEHPDQAGAWTFLRIPFDVQEAYGTRARVPVKGTVKGARFRSSLLPQGDGRHFLVVNKAIQKEAGASVGDTVRVVLELDRAPRTVSVPEALKQALDGNPAARENFESMPYSHQKEYVDWIESAKREDTRARRVDKAMGMIAHRRRLKGSPRS